MPTIEPGWEKSLLAGADVVFITRATPLATLSSLFSDSSFPVVATPPLSQPSPWPRPRRAHARTRACVHAPVHPRTCLLRKRIKPQPFSSCSSAELSSPAFRRGEPRRRPLWCRSTKWCECWVVLGLACPFLCTHARSLADTDYPSRAAGTPFHRARVHLAVVPHLLLNRGRASTHVWPSIALHTSSPLHWRSRRDTAGNPSLAVVDTASAAAPCETLTSPRRSSSYGPRLFFP
jgi:hypothetical protein